MDQFLLSPNGECRVEWQIADGRFFWRVFQKNILCLDWSPAGMKVEGREAWSGLKLVGESRQEVRQGYALPAFRKSVCRNDYNSAALRFEQRSVSRVVLLRAYDDGAALRLEIPCDEYTVEEETTAYRLPFENRRIFAMKHGSSYEDHYYDIPLEELSQNRLAMPVLVQLTREAWCLYTEADVFGNYGGSTLLGEKEDPMLLHWKRAEDQIEPISGKGTLQTPWRVVMTGNLAMLVESNLLENLNPPCELEDTSFIQGGMCAWTWLAENDQTSNIERIHDYIDGASSLGFPYYLADYGWKDQIDIPELVRYARERGVKIWLWEHRAELETPEIAEEKLSLWSSWGVAGLKIDFFESDNQARLQQMDMLAEIAARHRLMLNFHGCTKPAGEIRRWPHVLTREAVQGAEYLQHFSKCTPMGVDAVHDCTLPFTRNLAGPMDYTPVVLRSLPTGTTDVHQAALTVIFTSYIQHTGEKVEELLKSPLASFFRQVRAVWDETHLLEGFPGCYVTMARRSGEDWFVAGICAERPRNACFSLSFLDNDEYEATAWLDDLSDLRCFDTAEGALQPATPALCREMMAYRLRPTLHNHDLHLVSTGSKSVRSCDTLTVPMAMNGGFCIIFKPVK